MAVRLRSWAMSLRLPPGSRTATSPIAMLPQVGFSRKLMQRRSVDLPVPEGPMIETTSPR